MAALQLPDGSRRKCASVFSALLTIYSISGVL